MVIECSLASETPVRLSCLLQLVRLNSRVWTGVKFNHLDLNSCAYVNYWLICCYINLVYPNILYIECTMGGELRLAACGCGSQWLRHGRFEEIFSNTRVLDLSSHFSSVFCMYFLSLIFLQNMLTVHCTYQIFFLYC